MTQTLPDGPTDPRSAWVHAEEESTTIVPPVGGPVSSGPPAMGERAGRVYGGTGERQPDPDQPIAGPEEAAPGPGGAAPGPGEPAKGRTTIADQVVERMIGRIVDLAADGVAGVYGLHTEPGEDPATGPVTVQLDGDRAVIDIAIEVEFGHPVHEVVEHVRGSVISQAERLLGLTVAEVNVLVAGVRLDPAGSPDPGAP